MRKGARVRSRFLVLLVGALIVGLPASAEKLGSAPFECRVCGQHFADRQEAARHDIVFHHKPGCLKCGLSFASRNAEAVHAVYRHGARRCRICGRIFATNAEARRHLAATHHLTYCERCGGVVRTGTGGTGHAAACPLVRPLPRGSTAASGGTRSAKQH